MERSLRGEWPRYFWLQSVSEKREGHEARMVKEEGRECEGEIKEVWFSSPQLQTATAVTFLRLLSPLQSPRPFFSFLSCLLAACQRESRLQILWRIINSAVLMSVLSGPPIQKTNNQQTDVNFRLASHECMHSEPASTVQSFAVLTPAQVAVCETPAWWGRSSSLQMLLCKTTVDLSSTDLNNPLCKNSAKEILHFYYRALVTSQTRLHGGPEGSEGLICSFQLKLLQW